MQPHQYIPWLGSTAFEIALLLIMLRRKISKIFPVFFAYVVFDVVREIVVPLIGYAHPNQDTYFYAYWLSFPVEYTLTFLVILEVFSYIFRAHIKYSPATIRWFVALALVLLLVSILLVIYPDVPTNTMRGIVLALDRSASLLVCGLMVFIWVFSKNLGLSFRHHVWGIIFGLGIYSGASLIVAAIHGVIGARCPDWIDRITHFSYLGATCIWTTYLLREEPERAPLTLEEISIYRNLINAFRTILSDVRKAAR